MKTLFLFLILTSNCFASVHKYRYRCNGDTSNRFILSEFEPNLCHEDLTKTLNPIHTSIVEKNITKVDNTFSIIPLDVYKEFRYAEINIRTNELIDLGFVYDGYPFDSSVEARMNWAHMKQFQSLLPWPMGITTKNNLEYSLTVLNLDSFIGAALTHVNTVLGGGRYYKNLIKLCTTKVCVDLVVDAR